MNKRILELLNEATSEHEQEYNNKLNFRTVSGKEMEKFAQLIMQECAEWVNDNVGLIDKETRADLLKHFGLYK